jgi:hypothetical protein
MLDPCRAGEFATPDNGEPGGTTRTRPTRNTADVILERARELVAQTVDQHWAELVDALD